METGITYQIATIIPLKTNSDESPAKISQAECTRTMFDTPSVSLSKRLKGHIDVGTKSKSIVCMRGLNNTWEGVGKHKTLLPLGNKN